MPKRKQKSPPKIKFQPDEVCPITQTTANGFGQNEAVILSAGRGVHHLYEKTALVEYFMRQAKKTLIEMQKQLEQQKRQERQKLPSSYKIDTTVELEDPYRNKHCIPLKLILHSTAAAGYATFFSNLARETSGALQALKHTALSLVAFFCLQVVLGKTTSTQVRNDALTILVIPAILCSVFGWGVNQLAVKNQRQVIAEQTANSARLAAVIKAWVNANTPFDPEQHLATSANSAPQPTV